VIGLFMLMLLFSGVFFTLGYVMGRNQYDGQVRAASSAMGKTDPVANGRPELTAKKSASASAEPVDSDPATSVSNDPVWKFEENGKAPNAQPHLEPVPKAAAAPPASKPVNAKAAVAPPPARAKSTANTPLIPSGAYLLQVAALAKQDDALALASSLQKRHFAAYVQTPQKDKYYRVQVGPFKDQKSAESAKKGLESAGFRAFYVKH